MNSQEISRTLIDESSSFGKHLRIFVFLPFKDKPIFFISCNSLSAIDTNSSSDLAYNNISPAYRMFVSRESPWAISMPSWVRDVSHKSKAISKIQLKRIALSVSPCFTPLWIRNSELWFTTPFWSAYNIVNNDMYSSGNHFDRNVCKRFYNIYFKLDLNRMSP